MKPATSGSAAPVSHLAIIAGGKGTRLPGASERPKALTPVGGKPVLAHQLELARACGFTEATVFAGYLSEQIKAFVGDGSTFGLKARTVVEDKPLGNAGALVRSLGELPEHFAVLYGDVMLGVDLAAMAERHLAAGADFTALAHPNDHPFDSDLLETDDEGWVTAVHNYPHPEGRFFSNLVNAALYVVRGAALAPWRSGGGKVDFTKDIMPGLIARGDRVLAYRSAEYIKDMGTPDRLARVEADLAAGKIASSGRPAPAVFLDRDGTLNHDTGFLSRHEQLELLEGAGEALRSLRRSGYRLVVLTNQPVIARGEADEAQVAAIHRRLEWELGKAGAFLDGIYLCPHHPDRGFPGERSELKIACDCRKPATGLFQAACEDLNLDPSRSWMVGDQTADIELARRAGLRSILVRTGAAGGDGKYGARPDHVAADIAEAADIILGASA